MRALMELDNMSVDRTFLEYILDGGSPARLEATATPTFEATTPHIGSAADLSAATLEALPI